MLRMASHVSEDAHDSLHLPHLIAIIIEERAGGNLLKTDKQTCLDTQLLHMTIGRPLKIVESHYHLPIIARGMNMTGISNVNIWELDIINDILPCVRHDVSKLTNCWLIVFT